MLTGAFADELAAGFRDALAPGLAGWRDDDLAFVRPWGFALSGVHCPVRVWQGSVDRMVPQTRGPWLSRALPRATLKFWPGEGHLSLVVRHLGAILEDLRSGLS